MLQSIVKQFDIDGAQVSIEKHGNGHINDTYLVRTSSGKSYILQKINHHVFKDISGLMSNIVKVTEYLRRLDPDPRHVMQLIPLKTGAWFLSEADAFWRMTVHIDNSVSLDVVESKADMY